MTTDSTRIQGAEGIFFAAQIKVESEVMPVKLAHGGGPTRRAWKRVTSDLVSEEAVAHLREVAPHAEYADIADATHMVVGDANDAFSGAILDFLNRHHRAQEQRR